MVNTTGTGWPARDDASELHAVVAQLTATVAQLTAEHRYYEQQLQELALRVDDPPISQSMVVEPSAATPIAVARRDRPLHGLGRLMAPRESA